ncbi:MAG: FAD-dependent oxidoreductase [Bacteroidota bacterium]
MSEYKRPITEEDFQKNFKQKKPLMNKTEAYFESAKCLFCYDAPCMKACPTGIDIPLFIKQINTGNVTGSAKTIYDSNWMGNACSIVCPTGVLCEGACVYNHQDVLPVQIGRLQNYATKNTIKHGKKLFSPGEDNGKKVAIIGAGPAGISCACELRTLGYQVEVFEAKGNPSGLTVNGIAPYKITNEEVLEEINFLETQLDFSIHYNSPITTKEQIKDIESRFDAVFLGVGIGATARLNINGENFEHVIGAVEFIEDLRKNHSKTFVGRQVVVLGGGNTAMDAASESARMGADVVTLAYRRSKEDMKAYKFEYDLAISSGVTSLFQAQPLEIIGNGKVEGVKFVKTDGSNHEFIVQCDMVIKATGQAKQATFYSLIDNLTIDANSRVIVNAENNQSSNPKYFAGGDAINGGAEVVNGAYDGKHAAKGIHIYLNK